MKSKDLKKMIKPLIRECLTEIFAEIQLEKIVKGVMSEQSIRKPASRSFTEEVLAESVPSQVTAENRKRQVMDKLGISEEEWRTMYSDTDESDHPILSGDESDSPELVSENVLRQSGLLKDYSKFLP